MNSRLLAIATVFCLMATVLGVVTVLGDARKPSAAPPQESYAPREITAIERAIDPDQTPAGSAQFTKLENRVHASTEILAITGRITDTGGKSLKDVTLSFDGSDLEVQCDEDGFYEIQAPNPGGTS